VSLFDGTFSHDPAGCSSFPAAHPFDPLALLLLSLAEREAAERAREAEGGANAPDSTHDVPAG